MSNEDFEVVFCPFCGAEKKNLTGSYNPNLMYDKDVYEMYCNTCNKEFIVHVKV